VASAQVQYKQCILFSYLLNCELVTDPSLMQEDFGHLEHLPICNTIIV
jgi:hypothetical protein